MKKSRVFNTEDANSNVLNKLFNLEGEKIEVELDNLVLDYIKLYLRFKNINLTDFLYEVIGFNLPDSLEELIGRDIYDKLMNRYVEKLYEKITDDCCFFEYVDEKILNATDKEISKNIYLLTNGSADENYIRRFSNIISCKEEYIKPFKDIVKNNKIIREAYNKSKSNQK